MFAFALRAFRSSFVCLYQAENTYIIMALTGYRLHLNRLGYPTSSSSIRTIKFPLSNDYDKTNKRWMSYELEKLLATNIKQDYEKLYGSFNLTTYVNNSSRYSLKDLWLDYLKVGAIMKHTEAKLFMDLI